MPFVTNTVLKEQCLMYPPDSIQRCCHEQHCAVHSEMVSQPTKASSEHQQTLNRDLHAMFISNSTPMIGDSCVSFFHKSIRVQMCRRAEEMSSETNEALLNQAKG